MVPFPACAVALFQFRIQNQKTSRSKLAGRNLLYQSAPLFRWDERISSFQCQVPYLRHIASHATCGALDAKALMGITSDQRPHNLRKKQSQGNVRETEEESRHSPDSCTWALFAHLRTPEGEPPCSKVPLIKSFRWNGMVNDGKGLVAQSFAGRH